MNKIVHKDYLVNTLKSFESQVLKSKYISVNQLSAFKKEIEDIIKSIEIPAGKNVQIENIESIVGGNRITFVYYDDLNEKKTSSMEVMNGEKGTSIIGAKVEEDNVLTLELSDGQTIIAGQIVVTLEGLELDNYYTIQQSDEKFIQKVDLDSLIQKYLESIFQPIKSEEIKNIFIKE